MKLLISWLKRKKASLCILAAICALSLFVIITLQKNTNLNSGGMYAVKIKHYGIDAAEMERSAAIPLEDAFFSIPGVMSVHSSSENSVTSVYVRFKRGVNGRYEAVRDAAQRVYETLPSSAQRPEIISSNNSMIPVWSAAVISRKHDDVSAETLDENILSAQTQTLSMLEKIVKPRLESLEDSGEVIVSGAGIKEIYIILDQEKLSLIGLNPSAVASVLAMNDSIYSAGSIIHQNKEIIVSVDGRYDQIRSLNSALIPIGEGKSIELSEIALIAEQEREPDILSRLNGKKTVSVAIMGKDGGNLKKLSSDIKKELYSLSLPVEFIVLSDLGAEEASAFQSVINAALLGAIMVALISFLLNQKNNLFIAGFFCALSIPLICIISAAILSAFGFFPDRLLLAGIAAGLGTAIDAVILCSEKLRKCSSNKAFTINEICSLKEVNAEKTTSAPKEKLDNYSSAASALKSLTGPLLAGAATTVAALIPLTVIENGGAKIIANAVIVVTITSFVLSLTLLPPLLLWGLDSKKIIVNISMPLFIKNKIKSLLRHVNKFLAVSVRFCYRHSIVIIIISAAVTIIAILLLLSKGADTTNYGSEDSVYAQVEFEGGLLAEEVDRLLSIYSRQLAQYSPLKQRARHTRRANNNGIINIETGAKTGSGSLLISFDPKILKPQQVRDLARQISIPGGFIFFRENSQKDRYWEIFVYGDEEKKCRELAEELAYYCSNHSLVKERILNFKQGSKKMTLLPNREILTEAGVSFSEAINTVRLSVYGPVIYKRNNTGEETDVRIRLGGIEDFNYYTANQNVMRQTREGTQKTLVTTGNNDFNSSIFLNSLTDSKDEYEPSSIRRDNRRRYASITISTKPMDARRVKESLTDVIKNIDLPAGYSIEFDPEAVKQSDNLSATVLSLILAFIFCYMIIAAVNESFRVPFLILFTIPPSLAIPAICLVLSGSAYNSAIACAFVAVSGMTVNAAILCADSIRSSLRSGKKNNALTIYYALRQKMPALLATTGTTVAGAIPFFFLTENANLLIKTLSLVGALGVTGSLICSVTLIPSLLSLSKNFIKTTNN